MDEELAGRLAKNIKHLRDCRGLTQQQMAKLSKLPRATWANLESGASNPTLTVLNRVAEALAVSIEELLSKPRNTVELYPAKTLPTRARGDVLVRKVFPDRIPGMEIERIDIPPNSQLTGTPHTTGTREYLTCETGELILFAAGERFTLGPGDVVVFRGDQRHSYINQGKERAVGYSLVMFAPMS